MIPTRGQVKAQYQGIFDDDAGRVFTETVFTNGFEQAYDALFQGFLAGQVPHIRNITTVTVNANTTSLTPAAAGIADFADYVQLRERRSGSTDQFDPVAVCEQLSQRTAGDRLIEFVWRRGTFYFIGATANVELEITYESSGTAPTDDETSIGVDGCLSFLANYAAGVTGHRKGYDEIAVRCWSLAVGPKYDQGTIGGELFRLVQARVRSQQKTQIAPRPFTTQRRSFGWTPFIAAPAASGGGTATAPTQFTTADGTITGTLDGANLTFYLTYPVSTVNVYRNGVLMTRGTDYTHSANQILFNVAQVPASDDIITAEGWL